MTTFFLDLWHDLREKRLWPVAVGLLAATIAVPVVMLKPATKSTADVPVATAPAPREALPVVNVDTSPTHGSKLETFSQRNPFKPLSDLDKAESTANAPSSGAAPSSSSSSSSSSGGSSSKAKSGGGSAGGGSGSSHAGSAPTGGSPSGGSSSSSGGKTTQSVQWFRYTADLKFGEPGKEKTIKGAKALDLLPDNTTPAVVFMGVSNDGKQATFFVSDPSFKADGEGHCNSKTNCNFVTLTLKDSKNEETFTSADGNTVYDVKLLALHREAISADAAKGDTTDTKSKKAKKSGTEGVRDATDDIVPSLIGLSRITLEHK
jgi:hypothetical protein